MGKILHITVSDKIAKYSRRDGSIVCGNSTYSIKFAFDAEWDEHPTKTARFKYNGRAVDVPFEGDTVAVPKLRNTSHVTVGVFAGDLKTTTPAKIPCEKSILCEDGLPPDPEPEVYVQIMEMLNGLGDDQQPTSIDLSRLDPDDTGKGYIVETYPDGSVEETEFTYTDGKITKIKDSDGNETVLTW